MKKTSSILLVCVVISGCSVLPETASRRSPEKVAKLSNFELCRAALSTDLADHEIERSAIPQEVEKRLLNWDDGCFRVLLREHGASTVCSDFNWAVYRGSGTFLVGFATDLDTLESAERLANIGIDCKTERYIADRKARAASGGDVSGAILGLQIMTQMLNTATEANRQRYSGPNSYAPPSYDPPDTVSCRKYYGLDRYRCKID